MNIHLYVDSQDEAAVNRLAGWKGALETLADGTRSAGLVNPKLYVGGVKPETPGKYTVVDSEA